MKNEKTNAKDLARELVGDGGDPNLFFVSYGPYVFNGEDFVCLKGFDEENTESFGPFKTFEEALEKYKDVELDESLGIGQVIIEDRKTGTITERFLERVYSYEEMEWNAAKRFGYLK